MKRMKPLELGWIAKDSFMTTGYIFESKDGNNYVVWAKDMPNAKWLYENRLKTNTYSRDCETHFEQRSCVKPYFIKGTDRLQHRPFWYYGRVYKLTN